MGLYEATREEQVRVLALERALLGESGEPESAAREADDARSPGGFLRDFEGSAAERAAIESMLRVSA